MLSSFRCALLVVVAGFGCESESGSGGEENDPHSMRCAVMCAQSACDGVTELSPEAVERCQVNCVEKEDAASEVSAACESAYSVSVECVSELECASFKAWEAGDPAPCRDELARFESSCDGLEFTFVE